VELSEKFDVPIATAVTQAVEIQHDDDDDEDGYSETSQHVVASEFSAPCN
jgi:hypothetical protein